MSQKLKLDIEVMAEEFFENTRLAGIVAPVKDYQFCWLLNHHFRFNFRANPEVEIQLTKKKRQYFFTIYEFSEPNSSLKHYLYNNQHDGEYLLPEFKHLDFLWLMKGDVIDTTLFNEMLQSVKTIKEVQIISELSTDKIKNKGNLIF